MGDDVIADVHLGDWGLQMGLTELQLYEDGVLDYYFKGEGEEPAITLDMLNEAYPKASARKKDDEKFKEEADEWTLKIQNKEQPYYSIYKKIREVSVKEIKKHYGELGATFDLWYGESDAAPYIDRAIKIIEDKGLTRESDGALVVDVAVEGENIPLPKKSEDEEQRYKNPMPPAILKNIMAVCFMQQPILRQFLCVMKCIRMLTGLSILLICARKPFCSSVPRLQNVWNIS